MTDKEIRRMKDGVISIFEKFNILDNAATIGNLRDDILRLIGSMQERPGLKFNVGDKVRNDKIAGLPICTIESIDNTTYYCDYTNFDIIVQDEWELVVEPKECMYSKNNYTDEDRKVLCDGCEEECRFNKKEEPVNNGLDLGCGVIWKGEEPVSEDLENYINNLSKQFPEVSFAKLSRIAVRVAKWQEKQDQSTIELAEDHAMLAGMNKMEEEMMKNLWKPADGDDLPIIDREVIVLTQPYPLVNSEYTVSFAHRPNPDGWDGKSVTTGKVEHYTPKTYDKGGWNIPDVKYWLNVGFPKEIEI